jgi:hypothetical protein
VFALSFLLLFSFDLIGFLVYLLASKFCSMGFLKGEFHCFVSGIFLKIVVYLLSSSLFLLIVSPLLYKKSILDFVMGFTN